MANECSLRQWVGNIFDLFLRVKKFGICNESMGVALSNLICHVPATYAKKNYIGHILRYFL